MNMVTGLPSGCDLLVNNLQDNNVTKMRNIVFCVLMTCNLYVMLNRYAYWKSICLPLYSPFAFFLSCSVGNIAYWRVQEDTEKIHHFKVKSKLFHDCQAVSQSVSWASFWAQNKTSERCWSSETVLCSMYLKLLSSYNTVIYWLWRSVELMLQIPVFWNIMLPCKLVCKYKSFTESGCLHL